MAVAERGRDPAVGVALVGVPARSGLPGEGRPRARSLPAALARPAAASRRLRHLGRREDAVAGAAQTPPARRPGPRSPGSGRARVSAARDAGLPGRDGCPRPAARPVRPLRAEDQQRRVRRARGRGHDRRAVRVRPAGVLDRRYGTIHRGQKAIDRLPGAWPNLVLVHLPRHASWLNQIEIYFSILDRKALTPCHFENLDQLSERVLGFQTEYAKTATPFDWTFTRRDLHALLDRLDQRGRLTPAA